MQCPQKVRHFFGGIFISHLTGKTRTQLLLKIDLLKFV